MELMEHQLDGSERLGNGKVLYGGVGSGKSITSLHYYMNNEAPRHIFVITTAKKRDSLDWERDGARFGLGPDDYCTTAGILTVDSWNKIDQYTDIEDAFFIFDEQRLVGNGPWVKSFIKIARKNHWVLLSATPGDTWMDYAPIFIANGFYKNITDFQRQHVLYEPFVRYPKVRGYLNEVKLELLRSEVLVEMPFIRHTERMVNWLDVGFDQGLMSRVYKDRWNVFEDKPIKDVAELWRLMRRIVNTDPSRLEMVEKLRKMHPRLIVFYNFDYELEILRTINGGLNVFEWNGHVKDPLPEGRKWVYLVQYVAGAEAWNCTSTDAMCFYSLTYSYKIFEQAQGRIDRLDTLYTTLYYYVLVSNSVIDRSIRGSISVKKQFNERKVYDELEEELKKMRGDEGEHVEMCQI